MVHVREIKKLNLSIHAEPGSVVSELIAQSQITANHIAEGAITIDRLEASVRDKILATTEREAIVHRVTQDIWRNYSLPIISIVTEQVSFFRGFTFSGDTDGRISIDIGEHLNIYQDRIHILAQSVSVNVPTPYMVNAGTLIRVWVYNTGADFGQFDVGLFLEK